MWVIVLLANGCPLPAIVKAFGFDERTVKNWWQRAGQQCEAVHEHVVEQKALDLQHVQADEIRVKVQGSVIWMAMAMMVSTRLWLGGVISPRRDKHLIRQLADKIRQMALCRPLLLAVDGLSSYIEAFQHAFRTPLPGQTGRPRLIAWADIAIVQAIKHRADEDFFIRGLSLDCRYKRWNGYYTMLLYVNLVWCTKLRLMCKPQSYQRIIP